MEMHFRRPTADLNVQILNVTWQTKAEKRERGTETERVCGAAGEKEGSLLLGERASERGQRVSR